MSVVKQSSKDRLYAVAATHGWRNDPEAFRNTSRDNRIHDDAVWIIDDGQGDVIHIKFDLERRDGSVWSYSTPRDNKVRGLSVWTPLLGIYSTPSLLGIYMTTIDSRPSNTGRLQRLLTSRVLTPSGNTKPLNDRIEAFLSNPLLALWLAAEERYEAEQRRAQRKAEEQALREARGAVPAEVNAESEQWRALLTAVRLAGVEVERIDGTATDVRKRLESLRDAVASALEVVVE